MNTLAKRAGVALLPIFLLTACESAEDAARKPALVDEIVENSLARCDLQAEFSQTADYDARLKEALMKAYSESLDFVIDKDITVCLDRRMEEANDNKGAWGLSAQLLYYPDSKVISLYDNGDDYAHKGSFETAAVSFSGKLLDRFESYNDNGYLKEVDSMLIGRRHSKGYAMNDDGEGYAVIENNPELLTPPLAGNDI